MLRSKTTWQRATAAVAVDVRHKRFAETWERQAGSRCHRLLTALKTRHSLFSVFFGHGVGTLSRAQTIQVFLNSIALQLVVVSMLFVPRKPGEPLTVNPIKVIISGTLTSVITTPCVFIFAWAFHPVVLVRVLFKLTYRLLTLVLCFPYIIRRIVLNRYRERLRARDAKRGASRALRRTATGLAASKAVANRLARKCRGGELRHLSFSRRQAHLRASGGSQIVLRRDSSAVVPFNGEEESEETAAGNIGTGSTEEPSSSTAEPTSREEPTTATTLTSRHPRVPFVEELEPQEPEEEEDEEQQVVAVEEPSRRRRSSILPRRRIMPWGSGGSIGRDLQVLRGAAPRMARHASSAQLEADARHGRRHRRRARGRVLAGWVLNWAMLLALLQIFMMYACEYSTLPDAPSPLVQRELMFTWLWSVLQRILMNEPLVILSARGLPMLLRSKLCACLCSEACVDYMGHFVEAAAQLAKELVA